MIKSIAFASIISCVLFANEEEDKLSDLESRVTKLEQKQSKKTINPSVSPVVKGGFDFWLQGEALFFQPAEDNLNYSIAVQGDTNLPGLGNTPHGHVKNVTYDWSWGYRVGGGSNFQHDGWDLFIDWTSFCANGSDQHWTQPPSSGNLLTWGDQAASIDVAVFAKGATRLQVHFLDLELGREFFVSKWLTLRPFVGGRATWIERRMKVIYQALGIEIPMDKETIHLRNRFNGGGLRLGLDTQWIVDWGFSFYSDFALSLIYGTQHLHNRYFQHNRELRPPDFDLARINNNWTAVRPMAELALGIRWDKFFCNSRYRLRLQAGWEQQVLFGFGKDMNFTDLGNISGKFFPNGGDLSLSGVSFQARFDF
jgi:hypothetical protein